MSLTLKLALSPLLVAQALRTRARVPRLPEPAGPRAGVVGTGPALLRLLLIGDSSAAGVGVATQKQALSGQLVRELARRCAARVHWQLRAESGATTAQVLQLIERHACEPADLAIVVSGVNDVVDQVPSRRAVQSRELLANTLRNRHGVRHVVFCPLPPIHQFPALPQPLRYAMGADARRHNVALREWAHERAQRVGDVSYAAMDDLQLNRGVMASDGFHPGERAYRQVAAALAAHVAEHVWPHLPQPEGARS